MKSTTAHSVSHSVHQFVGLSLFHIQTHPLQMLNFIDTRHVKIMPPPSPHPPNLTFMKSQWSTALWTCDAGTTLAPMLVASECCINKIFQTTVSTTVRYGLFACVSDHWWAAIFGFTWMYLAKHAAWHIVVYDTCKHVFRNVHSKNKINGDI